MAGNFFDTPAGSSSSGLTWTLIAAADITSTNDPNSIENGAYSQVGDRIRVPVQSTGNHQALTAGLTYGIAWPGSIPLDGTQRGFFLARISVSGVPTGNYRVTLGLFDSTGGSGMTVGLGKSGSNMQPVAVKGGSASTGSTVSATALEAVGSVQILGDYDGVVTIDTAGSAGLTEGAGAEGAAIIGTSASADASNVAMVIAITRQGTGSTSDENIDIKAEWAYISLDGS